MLKLALVPPRSPWQAAAAGSGFGMDDALDWASDLHLDDLIKGAGVDTAHASADPNALSAGDIFAGLVPNSSPDPSPRRVAVGLAPPHALPVTHGLAIGVPMNNTDAACDHEVAAAWGNRSGLGQRGHYVAAQHAPPTEPATFATCRASSAVSSAHALSSRLNVAAEARLAPFGSMRRTQSDPARLAARSSFPLLATPVSGGGCGRGGLGGLGAVGLKGDVLADELGLDRLVDAPLLAAPTPLESIAERRGSQVPQLRLPPPEDGGCDSKGWGVWPAPEWQVTQRTSPSLPPLAPSPLPLPSLAPSYFAACASGRGGLAHSGPLARPRSGAL